MRIPTLSAGLNFLLAGINAVGLNGFRNVLYVGDWTVYPTLGALDPQKHPFDNMTHLKYSFGNVRENGYV